MKLNAASRRRRALSEVVGALLSITITIIAGAAVFGFVNNEAGVSEVNYANSVGSTDNYLAENFKIVDMYFASSTQIGIWVYNLGNVNFQSFSVRLDDCATGSACGANLNILYNYTGTTSKTDRVFDLRASSAYYHTTCRLPGSTYENPTISAVNTAIQNAQLLLLTIPPTTTNCPSYGYTFSSGTTYSVIVTGVYGNAVAYYQVR